MIHRNLDGWIIGSKSVMNAIDLLKYENKNKEISFHITEIFTILEDCGAIVIKKVDSNTRVTKNIIGENQIRNVLNNESRKSDSKLKRDTDGWYII